MGCSLPGSSVHGIFQARILKWLTIPSPGNLLQGSNPGLLQCRWILYCLSHQRSPFIYLYTPQSMIQITPRPDLSPMTDRSSHSSQTRAPESPSLSACFPSRWFSARPLSPWPLKPSSSRGLLQGPAPSPEAPHNCSTRGTILQKLRLYPRQSPLVPEVLPASLQYFLPRQ